MALAYLVYERSANGTIYFKADIGTQDFFQYKIGRQKRRYQGLDLIDEQVFASPILHIKTISDVFATGFTLPIPQALFKEAGRYIQLWSYKTLEKTGPAISPVLSVTPMSRDIGEGLSLSNILTIREPMEPYQVSNEAFSYTEKGVSESMFWNQLLQALPTLIDNALPIIRPLLGGNGNGSASPSASGNPTNDLVQAIAQLIQNIRNISPNNGATTQNDSPSNGSPTPTPPPASSEASSYYGLSQSLSNIVKKTISQDTLHIIQTNPRQMGQVINDSMLRMSGRPRAPYQYAEAKIAWAPIIAAVAPYVKDILELGNKNEADQRRHLEQLVSLLNDPSLTALLASMSHLPSKPKFTPSTSLYIDTSHLPKINLQQNERVVYQHGKLLTIPFRVATDRPNPPDRPIPKAIVQVSIQETEHLTVLWEKEFRLKDVLIHSLVNTVTILPEECQNLPVNQDLKVEITFLWQGKDRQKTYGIVKNQFITLVKESIFHRMGDKTGATTALNDLVKYRSLWHKIWEGGYTESRRWHIDFDAKYYYAFDGKEETTARLETRLQVIEDNVRAGEEMPPRRKVRAKLKSGMKLTAEALNTLLPNLGYALLLPDQLEAIKALNLQPYMNQTARIHVEMKGKSGDTASLWVYPEMDMHEVHLLQVSQTNEHGQVTAMSEQTVHFPRPAAIHFIGTQSL